MRDKGGRAADKGGKGTGEANPFPQATVKSSGVLSRKWTYLFSPGLFKQIVLAVVSEAAVGG